MGIKIGKVEISNKPDVVPRKPGGTRVYAFSVDFCDRRTWYADAQQVTGEAVGAGNGVVTVFNLDHGTNAVANEAILDLTRGRITDDHLIAPDGGVAGGYKPVVKVDGVAKTMREPYESSGGDYTLDFTTGQVSFFTAPSNGAVVTADYWYVPASAGPKLVISPPAGKKWVIDKAEAQITADFNIDEWFTDTIVMNLFHKALGLADPVNEVRYYNLGNLLDYSAGSFTEYPATIGERGLNKPTQIFRWEYLTPIELTPDYELRAWTTHQRPLGGLRATMVMYALQEDL